MLHLFQQHHLTPLFHGLWFILPFFFAQDFRSFFFFLCKSQCQGHYPLSSTLPLPSSPWPPPSFPWKFSVHCPPDSHPSTRVQFKKPFNSCHSKGPAISPAAKAQTGTRHQRATLNVRSVFPHPPIPNGLKVKDSISQRLLQRKTDGFRWSFDAALLPSFLTW